MRITGHGCVRAAESSGIYSTIACVCGFTVEAFMPLPAAIDAYAAHIAAAVVVEDLARDLLSEDRPTTNDGGNDGE